MMQYESIILELMTRIKNLEDEVVRIKEEQCNLSKMILHQDDETLEEIILETDNESHISYRKMTDEMIDLCYSYGKQVYNGRSVNDLADEINSRTGMNRNSAVMYLYAVSGMLSGTIYKRAINTKATQRYLEKIFDDYGKEGLQKALHSLRLHIDYRRECGHTIDSLEDVHREFEGRL